MKKVGMVLGNLVLSTVVIMTLMLIDNGFKFAEVNVLRLSIEVVVATTIILAIKYIQFIVKRGKMMNSAN